MSWKAIAFSEADTSHQKLRLPKFIKLNDFGETVNDGDIIIGAVSKSSEGCKHSDIGSELAVETAINYLQGQIKFVGVNEAKKNLLLDISKEDAEKVIQQKFLQTVTEVIKKLEAQSYETGCSLQDLSCTLLVMFATPKWLAAMQIGDGFIAIRQPESEYQLLFQPSEEQSANKAIFVTDRNAKDLMQFNILFGVPEFIFASTDSVEKLAFDIGEQSEKQSFFQSSFFELCRTAITSSSENGAKKIIQDRLNPEPVNSITANDNTNLVCFYKSPLSELNERNQLLEHELHEIKRKFSALQSTNEQLTKKLKQRDKKLSGMQSKNDKVYTHLLDQQSKNKELNEKLLELEDEKKKINKQIQNLQSQNQALNHQQQSSSLQKVAKVSKIIAIATTIAATAFGGLSFIQYQERNQLIKQIEQIRRQNNLSPGQWDLSSYSLESEWENFVNLLEYEEPLISDDLDELIEATEKKTKKSINELEQKISNLEAINKQIEEENDDLKSRNAELVEENDDRQNRINSLNGTITSLRRRISKLEDENEEQKNRINDLQEQNNSTGWD